MSLEPRGNDPQRLLPQSLEDRLLNGLARMGGLGLLVAMICVFATLATWSIEDPSLTHATTLAPRNALGAIGAIVSDLFLQTFGFVAVLALLPPLLWSVELLRTSRLQNSRTRIVYYPIAVLALAGALSSYPALSGMAAQPRLWRRHRRRTVCTRRQTVRHASTGTAPTSPRLC